MNQSYRLNPGVQITNVTGGGDEKPQFLAIETASGEKYELGEEEMFLLQQLHNQSGAEAIFNKFQSRFELNLSPQVLDNFISQMTELGLLQPVAEEPAIEAELLPPESMDEIDFPVDQVKEITQAFEEDDNSQYDFDLKPEMKPAREYMRFKLFNPHRLFNFLDWLLSPFTFLVWLIPFSCVAAFIVLFNNGTNYSHDLYLMRTRFGLGSLIANLILATFTVRLLSKLAQGTVLRHFGGTTDRFGLRLMFGILPRLFVDKRPIRSLERRGQLWTYAAPLLVKLSLFSGGIVTWFMTRGRGFILSDLAIFVGTISLGGFLFTANPLWRADGYNFMTVYLGMEGLRERAFKALKLLLLRRPFPPQVSSKERAGLVAFGMATVTFTLFIVISVIILLGITLERQMGGFGVVLFLASLASFTGWFMAQKKWKQQKAEIRMQKRADRALARVDDPGDDRPVPSKEQPVRVKSRPGRRKRTLRQRIFGPINWTRAIILGILGSLLFLPYTYEPGGPLTIHPTQRFELFARDDGEIINVYVREGQTVSAGELLANFYDLDLQQSVNLANTEIEQKQAELSLLRAGNKREEVVLARKQYEQAKVAMEFSQKEVERLERLASEGIISEQMHEDALAEAGNAAAEFAVAEANLALVASGPRVHEENMILASIQLLEQQADFYSKELTKRRIVAPADGKIITPKVHELQGKVLKEGQLFAVIEDTTSVRVEVLIPETDFGAVQLNARMEFKMLAYPDRPFHGLVTFISPVTEEMPDNPFLKAVRIVSEIDNSNGELKSDMTGYAKVEGQEELAVVAFTKMFVRFVLVEIWSWLP